MVPVARNNGASSASIERETKGTRLDQDCHAQIVHRSTAPDTELEVDHIILDYNAYRTIGTCLASRRGEVQLTSLRHTIAMSNAFLAIFRARHPQYEFDAELRFRILLLKLTLLFTQRMTQNPTTPTPEALKSLRMANHHRAQSWLRDPNPRSSAGLAALFTDRTMLPDKHELERNRVHILHKLSMPAEDGSCVEGFYGTAACVSLLDILPLFMQVSAARNALSNSTLNETWMDLAGGLMLQACLEQFLVYGAHGSGVVDEAFAWGHQSISTDGRDEAGTNEKTSEVNDMFEDAIYETEVVGWRDAKTYFRGLLVPDDAALLSPETDQPRGLISHLEAVSSEHPLVAFEMRMLAFLDALSQSIEEPVLVQLEKGQMTGMSKAETAQFLKICGLSAADSAELQGRKV